MLVVIDCRLFIIQCIAIHNSNSNLLTFDKCYLEVLYSF